jgi:hypothetical protein
VVKEIKGNFYTAIDCAAHRAAQSVVRKVSRLRDKARMMRKKSNRPWIALAEPGQ